MIIIKKLTFKTIFTALVLIYCGSSVFAQINSNEKFAAMISKGDNAQAVKELKAHLKKNNTDHLGWYYLGIANINQQKERDAIKALNEANDLVPNNAKYRSGLAYAHMLANNKKASAIAEETLNIDPKNVDALYVLSVMNLRGENYEQAHKYSKDVISLNQNYLNAYFVNAQSLISDFAKSNKAAGPLKISRKEMLTEAASSLDKYLSLTQNNKDKDHYLRQLEAVKFFAEHYKNRDEEKLVDDNSNSSDDARKVPYKIVKKSHASYTDRARENNVQGTIRLMVGLGADKTVKHVMILRSLGYGLDQNAVAAARQIEFEPAQKNGKPVSSVVIIEYGFSIR